MLVGLGTIVAGGGAALGTGAFSSVAADRDVDIEVADDADAFLSIDIHSDSSDSDFVEKETGDREIVSFDFSGDNDDDGLNDEARTDFHNLITITNNGSNQVTLNITAKNDSGNDVTDGFVAYEGDTPDTEIDDTKLGESGSDDPDDEIAVGFRFDTTNIGAADLEAVDTIEITAEEDEST
ncbi:hypothetical protein [Natronorubrum halalkaliphilum]|uniref:hypothetical protein n=1 Tax=Natronorubrum halalkaliphilum TaxID=2691917 RepID=UPI00135AFCF5|nr:hypothetical protein [Natronorubrum halalkaliphilum]